MVAPNLRQFGLMPYALLQKGRPAFTGQAEAPMRAADYLDAHADAFPVVSDLDRLDKEARLCRGLKP